jgi:hypothetical protein
VVCQVPEDLAARTANHVYLDLCFSADAAASAQNHHPAEPADPVYPPGQIENLFEVHLYHLVDPAPTIHGGNHFCPAAECFAPKVRCVNPTLVDENPALAAAIAHGTAASFGLTGPFFLYHFACKPA